MDSLASLADLAENEFLKLAQKGGAKALSTTPTSLVPGPGTKVESQTSPELRQNRRLSEATNSSTKQNAPNLIDTSEVDSTQDDPADSAVTDINSVSKSNPECQAELHITSQSQSIAPSEIRKVEHVESHHIEKIMRQALPDGAIISSDAIEVVQKCASEFITFLTAEACDNEQYDRKNICEADYILASMLQLGFTQYGLLCAEFMKKYRMFQGTQFQNKIHTRSTHRVRATLPCDESVRINRSPRVNQTPRVRKYAKTLYSSRRRLCGKHGRYADHTSRSESRQSVTKSKTVPSVQVPPNSRYRDPHRTERRLKKARLSSKLYSPRPNRSSIPEKTVEMKTNSSSTNDSAYRPHHRHRKTRHIQHKQYLRRVDNTQPDQSTKTTQNISFTDSLDHKQQIPNHSLSRHGQCLHPTTNRHLQLTAPRFSSLVVRNDISLPALRTSSAQTPPITSSTSITHDPMIRPNTSITQITSISPNASSTPNTITSTIGSSQPRLSQQCCLPNVSSSRSLKSDRTNVSLLVQTSPIVSHSTTIVQLQKRSGECETNATLPDSASQLVHLSVSLPSPSPTTIPQPLSTTVSLLSSASTSSSVNATQCHVSMDSTPTILTVTNPHAPNGHNPNSEPNSNTSSGVSQKFPSTYPVLSRISSLPSHPRTGSAAIFAQSQALISKHQSSTPTASSVALTGTASCGVPMKRFRSQSSNRLVSSDTFAGSLHLGETNTVQKVGGAQTTNVLSISSRDQIDLVAKSKTAHSRNGFLHTNSTSFQTTSTGGKHNRMLNGTSTLVSARSAGAMSNFSVFGSVSVSADDSTISRTSSSNASTIHSTNTTGSLSKPKTIKTRDKRNCGDFLSTLSSKNGVRVTARGGTVANQVSAVDVNYGNHKRGFGLRKVHQSQMYRSHKPSQFPVTQHLKSSDVHVLTPQSLAVRNGFSNHKQTLHGVQFMKAPSLFDKTLSSQLQSKRTVSSHLLQESRRRAPPPPPPPPPTFQTQTVR